MNTVKFTDQLTHLFTAAHAEDRFSGAVCVSRKGEPIFQAAYGDANRTWNIPNRIDMRYRIASIGKMFTAVAILQLIEQGHFTLETGVVDLLGLHESRLPQDATVRHLLTMTAGIADWFDESGDWAAEWEALRRQHPLYLFRRNQDYLPLFLDEEPLASVGAQHDYSGSSYILLGLIIEQATGCDYFDWIQQSIFAPAQMHASGFPALDDVAPNVAEGYIPTEDPKRDAIVGWQRNIYSVTAMGAADGGATSTVGDLLRFAQALRQGALLTLAMTRAMLAPHVLAEQESVRGYLWHYGFGNMFLLDDSGAIVRWGHTGEEEGVSCRLYHYPVPGLDVVILGNQSWCAGKLGWAVHDLITAL